VRRAARVAGGVLVSALLLTGCATASPAVPTASGPATASANPNTPALVAQRTSAGLPDCDVPVGGAAPLPDGLPAVVLPCLGSERSVDLSQVRGTPLVVNLWAQWCDPCKAEAPILAAFAARASGKVVVLGVDYSDPDPAAAIRFAAASGWRYPQLVDPDAVLRSRLTLPGIPVTLLVSADGRVVYRVTGGVASVDALVAAVKDRLGVTL